MENTIRSFIESLEKKDVEKALSFFTDDATWFTTQGTFKGKEQIRKYGQWLAGSLSDIKFNDEGIGIIAKGNKAVYQTNYEANFKGIRIKVANVCTYEFSQDKIKNHWIMVDKLSIAKQGSKGHPVASRIVNSVIARTEAGLHQ